MADAIVRVLMSATFTYPCNDCGRTVTVRSDGKRWHWCRMPRRLRGRVLEAAAESMRWTCEQAGHPKQHPDDLVCICAMWADHIEAGAVEVQHG